MAIRIVRLGTPRVDGEGVRIGTVRRPPRGVRKEQISPRYYDVWLPELAPSAETLAYAVAETMTPVRWRAFERKYKREMREPAARHLVALLAAMSRDAELSVGCYCEDETRCHRSVLRALLAEAGADIR